MEKENKEKKEINSEKKEKKFHLPKDFNAIHVAVAVLICIIGGAVIGMLLVPQPAQVEVSTFLAPSNEAISQTAVASVKKLFELQGVNVDIEVTKIEKLNDYFYTVSFDVSEQGQKAPGGVVYITPDLKFLTPSFFDVNEVMSYEVPAPVPVEAAKSDKPEAELYIFSYCPAGSVALASFAKAADVLKDSADVKVKFFSNMHGEHELQQNMIQECIQVVDAGKYWDYAQKFVSDIYPNCGSSKSVDCDKNESIKLMDSLGIDSNSVWDCVETQGPALYQSDTEDAVSLQLQYSPSVVVNGTYFGNADRSAEGLKALVCSAFNEAPEECEATLSNNVAPSGSCS
ncbi:MAG: hypothetical protein ABIA76_05490 [Candidatus Diapherotrites archaeon]